jgi:hypothetical protein
VKRDFTVVERRARVMRRAKMAPHSLQTGSLDARRCPQTGQAEAVAITIGLLPIHWSSRNTKTNPAPRISAPALTGGTTQATLREHRRVYKQANAFVVGSLAGAGNGIRTRDPDLGKVVLYH